MDFIEFGYKLGVFFLPFLFALCFHELAHGLVAKFKGDNTAELEGRLSMNPMVHADPIGTWVLPIAAIALSSPFFFGWAKPVPVDARNLKNPKKDMFWIALAGPASNVLLAILAAFALASIYTFMGLPSSRSLVEIMKTFLLVNIFLAVFNMIPIHPLDGGKVIAPFLPIRWNYWLEQNQTTLSMFLLFFLLMMGRVLAVPVGWLAEKMLLAAFYVTSFFA